MVDINDAINLYDKAVSMSTTPDPDKFPKYKEGHIIDEDQTVRWNKEKVAESQSALLMRMSEIVFEKS